MEHFGCGSRESERTDREEVDAVTQIRRSRAWRVLALLAALSVLGAACTGDDEADDQATGPAGATFSYQVATFADTTTDNFWAYYDPESSVWNAYYLSPTKPALYDYAFPGLEVIPDAAAAELPAVTADGDVFSAEVTIRDDANWSDGQPITAGDVVFTFETVRDLTLGGDWLVAYPLPDPDNPDKLGLTGIEAVNDKTVKISFNKQPGLAIWPHSVAVAPIMASHFWEPAVTEAKASEDGATALYAASGEGDPSGGPMVVQAREAGAFVRLQSNDTWHRASEDVSSGGESYTLGPFATEETQSLYSSQDAAVLALKDGEVSYLINPLGMQRGLQSQVIDDPNLEAVVNATNGYRYLAFNMRKEPMNDPAFRRAMATIIDKEFMANQVLQGVAFPLYGHLPEGNTVFYDEAISDEIAAPYQGKDEATRIAEAVQLLKDAGFTWSREPAWDEELGSAVVGRGMRMPNGQPVPNLELLAPAATYDPLRATYSVWIEQFGNTLGIPITANPTDFNTIVDQVFPSGEGTVPDYDMYILGWSLSVFPDHYEAFFHSRNHTEKNQGSNNTGYANEEFDAKADQLLAATTEEEAKTLIWEMERMLDQDLPYIVLFDTGILEFFRKESVTYPITESLSGLQYLHSSFTGHAVAASAK
jgi:peptide/nickel transport system substrate-binding protein